MNLSRDLLSLLGEEDGSGGRGQQGSGGHHGGGGGGAAEVLSRRLNAYCGGCVKITASSAASVDFIKARLAVIRAGSCSDNCTVGCDTGSPCNSCYYTIFFAPSADEGGEDGKNKGELHDDCGDCEREGRGCLAC